MQQRRHPGQVEQARAAEADQRVLPEARADLGHVPARARARRRARRPGRAPSCGCRASPRAARRRRAGSCAAPEREHVQEGRRGEQREDQHERVHAGLLRVGREERVDGAERGADQAGATAEEAPAGPHAARDRDAARSPPTGPASRPGRRRRRPSRPTAACSRAAASRRRAARSGCRRAAARRSRSRGPRPSRATRRASWCAGRARRRRGRAGRRSGSTKLPGSESSLGRARVRGDATLATGRSDRSESVLANSAGGLRCGARSRAAPERSERRGSRPGSRPRRIALRRHRQEPPLAVLVDEPVAIVGRLRHERAVGDGARAEDDARRRRLLPADVDAVHAELVGDHLRLEGPAEDPAAGEQPLLAAVLVDQRLEVVPQVGLVLEPALRRVPCCRPWR